jgi:outer membrane receptor protein involved in Fe transport
MAKSDISIRMKRAVLNLSEVVISANSVKREIETKGFAVNVIETQKTAIQSVQTNELLDRSAGVRVRQDGGLGSRINYNINGLSGEAIKIFIDGIPASNYGASFSLNSIPPSLIERIEIYKGIVPAYLAEDALGGAINIVLKQRRTKSLSSSYSLGSFNTHKWDMSGSYRWIKGLTVDGSAFYNYSDNSYKVWGDDIYFVNYQGAITESKGKKVKRFHDGYESAGAKLSLGFTDVNWADRLLLGVVLSQDYKEVQNGITMRTVYGDRHTRRNSGVLTLKYHKEEFLTDGLSISIDAAHSYLSRQIIDTVGIMYDWAGPIRNPDGSYVRYNSGAEIGNAKTTAINRDDTNTARVNLSYKIDENHTLYANYLFNDFQRDASDKYQPVALQRLKNTRDLQKNILSFTYENLAFSGRLRSNIFYKHYFQRVTSNEPFLENGEYKVNTIRKNIHYGGYGVTLSYLLLPDLYLLGSAEKTLRLPNADELFGNLADNLLPPSPGLEPEKSFNANIGVNYRYTTGDHSFGAHSSIYYRDTEGMIREAIRSGSFVYSQFENLEDVFTRGVDAEINYNYKDKVNFRFNVSKFDVLFNTKHDSRGNPYQFYRMQIRNEPSFKFSGNITYSHNDLFLKGSGTTVYYSTTYVEGFLRNWSNVGSSNLSRIPTQYPMDLGMAYTFPANRFVVSFDVKNIFDKQVYDNFGLQKPGRGFYAKVSCFIL